MSRETPGVNRFKVWPGSFREEKSHFLSLHRFCSPTWMNRDWSETPELLHLTTTTVCQPCSSLRVAECSQHAQQRRLNADGCSLFQELHKHVEHVHARHCCGIFSLHVVDSVSHISLSLVFVWWHWKTVPISNNSPQRDVLPICVPDVLYARFGIRVYEEFISWRKKTAVFSMNR